MTKYTPQVCTEQSRLPLTLKVLSSSVASGTEGHSYRSRAVELFCPHKSVIGFDSFAGFPAAAAADLGPRIGTVGAAPSGWTDTSIELVEKMLDAPATIISGFFEETLAASIPDVISLLHLDCDMYESTKIVLASCVPRMSVGGLIILDEYNVERWPGETIAVDEVFPSANVLWEPSLARFVVRL